MVLSELLWVVGEKNVVDKTIGNSIFKREIFEKLPDKYTKEEKEKFFNDLVKEKYITQVEGFTVVSNGGQEFNYNKKTTDFEKYLKTKSLIKNDDNAIIKMVTFYKGRKNDPLFWGGKTKRKKNKSFRKRKNTYRK